MSHVNVAFNSIKVPQYIFETAPHQPVWCISPILRRPLTDTFHEIWLDTNVVSQSTYNPNIAALVRVACAEKIALNPMFALAELHRSHEILAAGDLMLDKVPRFEEFYGYLFDMETVIGQSLHIGLNIEVDRLYVKRLADSALVIKYFYNKAGLSFEKRLEGFAKLVRDHLPYFAITFYVACLYFFAKEPSGKALFGKKLCSKIDGDMALLKDKKEENLERALNLGSDMALHTQATAYPVTAPPHRFRIPYIATSDKGLALLLREIGYQALSINSHKRIGQGWPAFREGGIMFSNCPPPAGDILERYLVDVPYVEERLTTLDAFAKAIASETFDHTKV